MKKSLFTLTVILAIGVSCFANDKGHSISIEGSILTKGKSFTQEISHTALSKQPDWKHSTKKCPMAPSKAIKLATATLSKIAPELKLTSVSLEKVTGLEGKWYYIVNYFENPDSMEGDYANIIVCLDGTVPKLRKAE